MADMTMHNGVASKGGDPGLDLPWYGIGFGPAIVRVFKKYATFDGRASRGEYWWFYLFNVLAVPAAISLIMTVGTSGSHRVYDPGYGYTTVYDFNWFGVALAVVTGVYVLAAIVPGLAVMVRRLHDTGKSGAWFFVSFIPWIGSIWMIVLLASSTNRLPNQWDWATGYCPPTMLYGPGPYGPRTLVDPPYPPSSYQPSPYPPSPYPPSSYPPSSYPPSPYPPSPYPPSPYDSSGTAYSTTGSPNPSDYQPGCPQAGSSYPQYEPSAPYPDAPGPGQPPPSFEPPSYPPYPPTDPNRSPYAPGSG